MGNWVKQGSYDTANIYLKNAAHNSQLYLGLFTNDVSALAVADLILTNLVEPVYSEYARQVLLPSSWVTVNQVSTYPDMEFMVESEPLGTIYGCFITNVLSGTSGYLIAVHTFTAPLTPTYYGDKIVITPRITIT